MIALAVIILAIIVIGEAVVYTSDYTDYSAEVSFSGGDLTYSVSADGSKEYDVVIMDNGSYGNVSKLYLYYDTSYPTDYKEATVPVGAKELDQEYYLEQMVYLLEYRNFHNVEYVDAEGLRDVMESSPEGVGILMTSGVLPDTVYTGSEDDPIFKWIQSGGSLYWVGNLIGQSYATAEGDIVPVDGPGHLEVGLLHYPARVAVVDLGDLGTGGGGDGDILRIDGQSVGHIIDDYVVGGDISLAVND